MSFLTKEQILEAQDSKVEIVKVKEWGGDVRVKTMSAKERDTFEMMLAAGVELENVRAKFVANTVVDDKGKLLFTEEDVEALGAKSASAMDKIFAVAQKLAGLRKQDVEELTKN